MRRRVSSLGITALATFFLSQVGGAHRAMGAIGDIGAASYGCQSIPMGGGSHVLNLDQGFGINAGDTAILVGATVTNLPRGTVTDSTGMNGWTADTAFVPSLATFLISSRITTAIPSGGHVTLPYTANATGSAKESCVTLVVFSGLWKAGSYIDQLGSASGGANPVSVSTNAGISQAEELVIGSMATTNAFASFTNNVSTSTRNAATDSSTLTEIPIYAITNSTGVKTLGGSFTPTSPWAVALATYRSCATDTSGPSVLVPGATTVTQTICQ